MSGVWVQVLQFLAALSLLIVLHEGGHFFFAKLFKTKVEKFYLFFDFLFPFSNVLPFSLWKKKKGDTEYGIGWFPLGGYVKIAGMVDESMDKDQLAKPPEPWEFRSKKAWQRLLIMLGGIIVNVLTAYIIYVGILTTWGEQRTPMNKIAGIEVTDSVAYNIGFRDGDQIQSIDGQVIPYYEDLRKEIFMGKTVEVKRATGEVETLNMPIDLADQIAKVNKATGKFIFDLPYPVVIKDIPSESPNAGAALQPEDKVIAINGQPATTFAKFTNQLLANKGQSVNMTVERNGQQEQLQVKVTEEGKVGIELVVPNTPENFKKLFGFDLETKEYTIAQAIPAAFTLSVNKVSDYLRQFKLIFNFKTKAYKQVGGFISMGQIFPKTWSWYAFWNITAFISIALAIMNLLPIPGLDGGYVIFTLWEMITGRKVNEKFMEVVTTAGLILLLAMMVLVNGNDIFKLFMK